MASHCHGTVCSSCTLFTGPAMDTGVAPAFAVETNVPVNMGAQDSVQDGLPVPVGCLLGLDVSSGATENLNNTCTHAPSLQLRL